MTAPDLRSNDDVLVYPEAENNKLSSFGNSSWSDFGVATKDLMPQMPRRQGAIDEKRRPRRRNSMIETYSTDTTSASSDAFGASSTDNSDVFGSNVLSADPWVSFRDEFGMSNHCNYKDDSENDFDDDSFNSFVDTSDTSGDEEVEEEHFVLHFPATGEGEMPLRDHNERSRPRKVSRGRARPRTPSNESPKRRNRSRSKPSFTAATNTRRARSLSIPKERNSIVVDHAETATSNHSRKSNPETQPAKTKKTKSEDKEKSKKSKSDKAAKTSKKAKSSKDKSSKSSKDKSSKTTKSSKDKSSKGQKASRSKSPAKSSRSKSPTKSSRGKSPSKSSRSKSPTSKLARSKSPKSRDRSDKTPKAPKSSRSQSPTQSRSRSGSPKITNRSNSPTITLTRSKSPTSRLSRSKSPLSKLSRSKSPLSRLARSKSPATKLPRSMSPAARLARSKSPTSKLPRSRSPKSPRRAASPSQARDRSDKSRDSSLKSGKDRSLKSNTKKVQPQTLFASPLPPKSYLSRGTQKRCYAGISKEIDRRQMNIKESLAILLQDEGEVSIHRRLVGIDLDEDLEDEGVSKPEQVQNGYLPSQQKYRKPRRHSILTSSPSISEDLCPDTVRRPRSTQSLMSSSEQ